MFGKKKTTIDVPQVTNIKATKKAAKVAKAAKTAATARRLDDQDRF